VTRTIAPPAKPPVVPVAKPASPPPGKLPPQLPSQRAKATNQPPIVPVVAIAPPANAEIPVVEVDVEPVAKRTSSSSSLQFNSEPEMLVSPRKRRKQGISGALVGVCIFLVLACGAAAGVWYFRDAFDSTDPESDRAMKTKGNFTLGIKGGWKQDSELREKWAANLALSLRQPKGGAVVYYRDFQTRQVSDAELFDWLMKRLKKRFPRVEYEDPFAKETKGRDGDLDGNPCLTLNFSANDTNDVPLSGVAYLLSRQGYAYWLVCFGPDEYREVLGDKWEIVRQNFKLYNEREGWKPTPPETINHTGFGDVAFQLNFLKEVWLQDPNPAEGDPLAELYLRGFEPIEDPETGRVKKIQHSGKVAEVLVMVMPKTADLKTAVAQAQEYLRKKNIEAHPGIKFEPATERGGAKTPVEKEVGALPGHVERLRIKLDQDNEKFGLLAVAHREQGNLVIYGETKWERRAYWEQELKTLLGSVREAKKAP
jgi:hypothetical protein